MAVGAFIAYGGWAAYANHRYGLTTALVSALAQGTISFLVTAFMTLILEAIFYRFAAGALRFVVTAIGAQVVVALVTFTVHYVVGTPEIIVTMTPSFIVSSIYSVVYTTGMHIRDRRQPVTSAQ